MSCQVLLLTPKNVNGRGKRKKKRRPSSSALKALVGKENSGGYALPFRTRDVTRSCPERKRRQCAVTGDTSPCAVASLTTIQPAEVSGRERLSEAVQPRQWRSRGGVRSSIAFVPARQCSRFTSAVPFRPSLLHFLLILHFV